MHEDHDDHATRVHDVPGEDCETAKKASATYSSCQRLHRRGRVRRYKTRGVETVFAGSTTHTHTIDGVLHGLLPHVIGMHEFMHTPIHPCIVVVSLDTSKARLSAGVPDVPKASLRKAAREVVAKKNCTGYSYARSYTIFAGRKRRREKAALYRIPPP